MKRRLVLILLAVMICSWLSCPVSAAGRNTRLVDQAELLDASEQADILNELNAVSQKHQVDLVIVTTDMISPKSPQQYADDFFDYNGYGYGSERDGVLLLISMEDSDWWISTSGYGITALTDAGIEYIGEQITPDLSIGDYAYAFQRYIELCDEFIAAARNGRPYDTQNLPKEPFDIVLTILFSVVIGFTVAFIATAVMKGQLKSIRSQRGAVNYVKAGSLNVSEVQDMFLYRDVTRRSKPQSSSGGGSSTHRSSSGRSHGGGGGKF